LTLSPQPCTTTREVLAVPNSAYAQWRLDCGVVPLLHEERDTPPEYLLQAIWQHQRLRRNRLTLANGQTIRVLHPGFLNREGGPDFRGAVIQFGDAPPVSGPPPVSGDVEVDIHASGWRAHGHHRNPAFEKVVLHAIWDAEPASGAKGDNAHTPSARPAVEGQAAHLLKRAAHLSRVIQPRRPQQQVFDELPEPAVLLLKPFLDASIGELTFWLNTEPASEWEEELRGRCCRIWRTRSADAIRDILRQAAEIRFRSKAAQFQARAREAGWEQALWEGLFRALGYKHNAWPMQCIAETRRRWLTPGLAPGELQARLLGLSGLLPSELTRSRRTADRYLRELWDQWWRERDAFADCSLPPGLWRFHGQRPANHPQRPLVLAAHWAAADELPDKLEHWCTRELQPAQLLDSLADVLKVERDPFWSWHWTIRSSRLPKASPLLGASRVSDLAVNAILPWLWIRAAEGKNEALQAEIEKRFNEWPPSQDNSLLRFARQRMLNGAPHRTLRTAAEQQGLIQIVRDFCDHSNAICENCRFPELLNGNDLRMNTAD